MVNNQDLPISGSWQRSSEAAQELILFAQKVSLSPFSPNPEQSCWDKHGRIHEQPKNFLVFKEMFCFKQNDQSLNLGKVQPIQMKSVQTQGVPSGIPVLSFCSVGSAKVRGARSASPPRAAAPRHIPVTFTQCTPALLHLLSLATFNSIIFQRLKGKSMDTDMHLKKAECQQFQLI